MKTRSYLIALVSAAFVVGCGDAGETNTAVNTNHNAVAPAATAPATPPDELAEGRKIFKQNCAMCHKEDGTGGKVTIEGKSLNADDLTSAKIKAFSDDKIIGYVYNGVEDEGMPSFKDKLSEAQIREVVRYVRAGIQKMPEPAATGSPK